MADEQQKQQQEEQDTEQQQQQPPEQPDAAEAVEALKRKNQELLGELKRERETRRQYETEQEKAQREKMEFEGKHKELAEQYQKDAEAYKRELSELKASIANKAIDNKALELASENASDSKNAKLLARFLKEELDFVDDGVVAKGHASIDDLIKTMEKSGDYASLWKGNGSSGGGAPGGKNGGGAATKKLADMNSVERAQFKADDPEGFRKALQTMR